MSESGVVVQTFPVRIAGVARWFVIVTMGTARRVYELAVSERKRTAQMQTADAAVVPLVLRAAGQR